MGWMNSDTLRLKENLSEFSSVRSYRLTPKALAKTVADKGTACLLGEANGEYFFRECVQAAAKKNSKAFVPFTIRTCTYRDAFVEAGMLAQDSNGNVTFTTPGIAWLYHKYRLQ